MSSTINTSSLFKDIKKGKTLKEKQIQHILRHKILKKVDGKDARHDAVKKLIGLISIGKPTAAARTAFVIFEVAIEREKTLNGVIFPDKTYRYLVSWICKSDIYIDKVINPYLIDNSGSYSYDMAYARYVSDKDVESILSKSIKRIRTRSFSNNDNSLSYANAKRLHFFLFLLMDRKGVSYAMDFFVNHKSLEYIQGWFNCVLSDRPRGQTMWWHPFDNHRTDMNSSFCVSYKKEDSNSVTMYAYKNPTRAMEENMNYSLNVGHAVTIPFHENLSTDQLIDLFEWADKHLTFEKEEVSRSLWTRPMVSLELFKNKFNYLLLKREKDKEQKQKKESSNITDGLVTYKTSYEMGIGNEFIRFAGKGKQNDNVKLVDPHVIITEIEKEMDIERFDNALNGDGVFSASYMWLESVEDDLLRKYEEDLTDEDKEKEFCYEYSFKGDGKKITLIITNKELEKNIE